MSFSAIRRSVVLKDIFLLPHSLLVEKTEQKQLNNGTVTRVEMFFVFFASSAPAAL